MICMDSKNPLISVIMGVCYKYNTLHYLQRSLSSILSQTYSNWELLICENGSTKEAIGYLKSLAASNPKVRLIDGTNASTLAAKLNRCLTFASGDFIARMDDDDQCKPNRFACQISFLLQHPEFVAVGCWIEEIDAPITHIRKLPEFPSVPDFRITFPFVHPALLFRKQPLWDIGGYSQSSRQIGCDDYDIMLRLYEQGYRAANLQQVLLYYSIASSQLKRRPYILFWNEAVTRFQHFRTLRRLPGWFLWVLKPLIVGLLPRSLLYAIKSKLRS